MMGLFAIIGIWLLLVGWAALRGLRGQVLSRRQRWLALGLIASLPLLTAGLYATFGHPGLPPHPFAVMQAQRHASDPAILNNAERALLLEDILRQHPGDGEGWRLLGHVYLSENRLPEAVQAFARAMRLRPDDADAYAGYAGARLRLSDGQADATTQRALAMALQLNPRHVSALVLSLTQAAASKRPADVAALRARLAEVMPPEDPRWQMVARFTNPPPATGAP